MIARAESAIGRPSQFNMLSVKGDNIDSRPVDQEIEFPSSRRALSALDYNG